jgi:hypothetical protein
LAVEADANLRDAFLAQRDMARLIALKRYETPEPAQQGRVSHRVLLRIQAGDLPTEDSAFAFPVWARVCAATAMVAAFSVFSVRELVRQNAVEAVSADPVIADAPPVQALTPSLQFRHLDPFTTVPTGPNLALGEDLSPEVQLRLREAVELYPFGVSNSVPAQPLVPVSLPLAP